MSEIHLNPEFERQRRPVVDAQTAEESAGINPLDIIQAIFRHKWLVIIMAIVGVIGAVVAYVAWPATYVSEAKILIRYILESKNMQSVDQGANNAEIKSADPRGDSIISSEIEIITSLDLAERVAEIVGPAKILGKQTVLGPPQKAAAGIILANLEVEAPKRSSVLRLGFKHSDGAIVQEVLDCVITNYLDKHIKIHRAVGINDNLFMTKRDEFRSEIKDLDDQIRNLKVTNGVVAFDEAKKANQSQLAKVSDERMTLEIEMAALRSIMPPPTAPDNSATNKVSSLTNQPTAIATTNPPPVNTSTPEYANKLETYRNTCSALSTLQRKELDLSIRYTSEYTELRNVREQIAEYKKSKEAMEKETPSLILAPPIQSTDNSRPSQVNPALEPNKLISLLARYTIITNQINNLRVEAMRLDQAEIEYNQLTRRKEIADLNYRKYSASYEQSTIDKNLGPGNISNISIVQYASPAFIEKSKKSKICAGLFVGGLLLGLALSIVMDLFLDASIKRPADVKNKLKLPLFLWIPNIKELSTKSKEQAVKKLESASTSNKEPGTKNQEPSPTSPLHAPSSSLPAPTSKLQASSSDLPAPSSTLPAPTSPAWSSYCTALRDRLMTYFEVKNMTHKPKLVAITSASQGVGVSSIAAELAALFSETGEGNVLLVDMNRDQGTAHPFYRGQPGCGISDALNQDKRESAQVQENLYMATMDDFNGKLSTAMPKKFGHLVPRMKTSDYDYIIFDMPPVSQTSVTARLATHMDINLMVIEAEKDAAPRVQEALEHLKTARANVGAVLNKRHFHLPKSLDHEV